MADMTCLACGEVYTEQERHELHEMREEFFQVGDNFICPDCWDHLKRMNPEDVVEWALSQKNMRIVNKGD